VGVSGEVVVGIRPTYDTTTSQIHFGTWLFVAGSNTPRKPIQGNRGNVRDLARYYRRSPELISYEAIMDWVYQLTTERLM
jgi:hypothetical protein